MFFFFFNYTSTTEIYTLSLHDALPICFFTSRILRQDGCPRPRPTVSLPRRLLRRRRSASRDRKSTRLNSSHVSISYAVFCLKKKKKKDKVDTLLTYTVVKRNSNDKIRY